MKITYWKLSYALAAVIDFYATYQQLGDIPMYRKLVGRFVTSFITAMVWPLDLFKVIDFEEDDALYQ